MTDNNTENQEQKGHNSRAHFRPSRWPSLVWAVPVAALIIVAWIGIKALVHNGPEVNVTFPLLGGVKTQHTKVKYHGAVVGHVSDVHIYPIRDTMKVGIRFNSDMEGYLARGTQFWVVGHSFHATSMSSVKTLITGPYIDVEPVKGKTWHKFIGASKPPILKHRQRGKTFVLVTQHIGNIARGSKVYYRHIKVGAILGYHLTSKQGPFHIYAYIETPYAHLVRTTTKFWDASAVHVALGGRGPIIQLQSLPALVSGAVAFRTPEHGRPVPKGAHFTLYRGQSAAREAPAPVAVRYQLTLAGGPHGLKKAAPVSLEGADVGSVTSVRMRYDKKQGRLVTHVRLALDPRLLGLPHTQGLESPPDAQVNQMLRTLIQKGLRAERARSTPLVGAPGIVLTRIPGAAPASLGAGNPPIIPTVSAGGIKNITRQVSAILVKIRALPLAGIAHNIQIATTKLMELSRSQKTKNALSNLKTSLANVKAITKSARQDLPGVLSDAKKAAHAAEQAVQGIQGVIAPHESNPGFGAGSLSTTLHQVSEAARSLRTLANYLDRHPNALLIGKGR